MRTNSSIPSITIPVWRREGALALAFWGGNFANVVRIIPNKGILFMCNEAFGRFLSTPGENLTDMQRLLAGSLSGATLITVTYPLDITQTRLATSTKSQYKGIIDCMTSTVRLEGLRGLYKGYVASVIGVSPYTGAQFYSYEKFKGFLQNKDGKTTLGNKLIAGAAAGAFAQTITYPLDTVRRRIQVQGGKADGHYLHYRGTLDCIVKIGQKEGLAGFYRGALVNIIRAAPSQAIQFAVYGWLKDLFSLSSSDS